MGKRGRKEKRLSETSTYRKRSHQTTAPHPLCEGKKKSGSLQYERREAQRKGKKKIRAFGEENHPIFGKIASWPNGEESGCIKTGNSKLGRKTLGGKRLVKREMGREHFR